MCFVSPRKPGPQPTTLITHHPPLTCSSLCPLPLCVYMHVAHSALRYENTESCFVHWPPVLPASRKYQTLGSYLLQPCSSTSFGPTALRRVSDVGVGYARRSPGHSNLPLVSFRPLVHAPSATCNTQGWAEPQFGARSSIRVSLAGEDGGQGPRCLCNHSCFRENTLAESWIESRGGTPSQAL